MAKFLRPNQRNFKVEVNRNTFDRSRNRLATYNFGYIYPFLTMRVHPNQSYRIRPTGLFKLLPTISELSTQVKLNVAAFYGRNRTLWRNFKPFIMQDKAKSTNQYPHPFISRSENFCKVGSLAQHLGVASVSYGRSNYSSICKPFSGNVQFVDGAVFRNFVEDLYYGSGDLSSDYLGDYVSNVMYRSISDWSTKDGGEYACFLPIPCAAKSTTDGSLKSPFAENFPTSFNFPHNHLFMYTPMTDYIRDYTSGDGFVISHISRRNEGSESSLGLVSSTRFRLSFLALKSGNIGRSTVVYTFETGYSLVSSRSISVQFNYNNVSYDVPIDYQVIKLLLSSEVVSEIQACQQKYGTLVPILSELRASNDANLVSDHNRYAGSLIPFTDESKPYFGVTPGFFGNMYYPSVMDVSTDDYSPFVGLDPSQGLNALPFRFYEAIYNSHFRDRVINPFRIDGVVQVDNYVTNNGDGADSTTPVDLQVCNYESDYFNDCVPSPQGNMFDQPLVGITVAEQPDVAILHYSDGGTNYDVEVSLSGSGNMTGVNAYSQDANHHTIDILKDAISYGINLHDLETVRAATKWYEATYRKGRFSYDDFIGAHFGKVPQHDEMMPPEFLGAYTTSLDTMSVINNSANGDVALGASTGLGQFSLGRDDTHEFECFCDEDGFVMLVCWFSVVPTYSQSMEKFWFASHQADYATPEFADLGCEPVLNREIAPLQCDWSNSDPDSAALGTFGYQRIYGDMIASLDDSVGLYTTNEMSSYVLNRLFDGVPKLGQDFRSLKPEDLTNVFVQSNDKDKIYGVWHCDVQTKVWLSQKPNAQIF